MPADGDSLSSRLDNAATSLEFRIAPAAQTLLMELSVAICWELASGLPGAEQEASLGPEDGFRPLSWSVCSKLHRAVCGLAERAAAAEDGKLPSGDIFPDLEGAIESMKACLQLHCISLGSLLGDDWNSHLIELVFDSINELEAEWQELHQVACEMFQQEREERRAA